MKRAQPAELSSSTACIRAVAAIALLATPLASIAGQRPLADFLSRQGAWCAAFTDEGIDCAASHYGTCDSENDEAALTFPLFWFDPGTEHLALIDALGDLDMDGSLGTTVQGSVSETGRPAGPSQVTVVLHSRNALARAYNANFERLFGEGGAQGTAPTLGDATVQLSFTHTEPGAPLPDVSQLMYCPLPGQALELLSIRARASGTLRAAFGVPDGTPGRLEVIQTGLIGSSAIAHPDSAVGVDAFPAEKVILRATGN